MKRIAVIGYGNMGKAHIKNLETLPGSFAVAAVHDIDPAVCAGAAADGFEACESLDALLARDDVDICLIATPNDSHKPLSIACLAAGKHVICEKPVALDAGELAEILAVARLFGRVFTVDQNRRWDRDFLTVKALAQAQDARPIFIDSRIQGAHGFPDNWLSRRANGGGMLMDWGVHLIDQLLCMVDGAVAQVYAQAVVLPGRECEENVKVLLRFSGGECAQLQMDTRCYEKLPRWHVMYPDKTAVIRDFGDAGTLYYEGGQAAAVQRDGYHTGSGPSRTLAPSEEIVAEALDFAVDDRFVHHFYQNVADAIDGKAELYVKPDQVMRVMRVLDAAKLSIAQGCAIRCDI